MILIPKYKDIILPVKSIARMSGQYRFDARGADGRIRPLTGWIPNLITNTGANTLGGFSSPFTTCAVGSGNATPLVTDTALQSIVASTITIQSSSTSTQSSPPYYGSTTVTFSFATGTAAGNLSEVGIGPTTTSLFSRALILDSFGSPTTITVLSSEALFVTYQLNQYVPTADVTGSINISGTPYAYTLRAANATGFSWVYQGGDAGAMHELIAYNGAIASITGSPSGAQAQSFSIVNDAYSSGSHTSSGTATFDISNGNLSGGITALMMLAGQVFSSRGNYQIGLGTAIPKDGSHVLTLALSHSWVVNSP